MSTTYYKANSNNRSTEIVFEYGFYEVTNLINDTQLSRAYPPKRYKSSTGAIRYAHKFLFANN